MARDPDRSAMAGRSASATAASVIRTLAAAITISSVPRKGV
ncbi:hypothetical protein [Roseovarius sp. TM1035]|nr:hypothetical protein [Roseovarius sp. TM1035]